MRQPTSQQMGRQTIWHTHPMFSGLIGSVLGAIIGIIGTLITNNVTHHNYIPFDNINVLLETHLVSSGCIDESILTLNSPDEQFKMIETTFLNNSKKAKEILINLGADTNTVHGLSYIELMENLFNYSDEIIEQSKNDIAEIENLKNENQSLNNIIGDLNKQITNLKDENRNYSQQKTVELKGTNLIIDGELMNAGDSINNTVAVVDGNNYYSQSFLNTYILDTDSHIKYNEAENAVVLGNQKPEKIKLDWDGMVTDTKGVGYFSLGDNDTFSMGTDIFNEGCVLGDETSFYIHLKNKFSKMSFTYGHIDDTSRGNLDLTILALDENKETYTTIIKTITLSGEMEPKDIEIPLSYASAIKILVSDGDYNAMYGLANIYFYS